jgi:hypothetical protein
MRARTLPFVAVFLLVAWSAAAQSPPSSAEASAAAKAAAQETFERGNRLFNEAEQKHDRSLYEAAYLQFSQAFAIFPKDKILWNLTVTECKTDRFVEALRHLRIYDGHEHVADQPSHPDHAQFVALLAQASGATGHVVIDAPPGAKVRVDQNDAGTSPLADPIDVAPGPHAIEATLIDGKTVSASASPVAGQTFRVTLAEQAQDSGGPTATAEPSASAAVNVPPDREPRSPGFFTARNSLAFGLGVVAVAAVAGGAGFAVASGGRRCGT